MTDLLSHLRTVPFFKHTGQEQLLRIAKASRTRRCAAGETILREGEPADAFYLVVSGDVRVFTLKGDGEPIVLARLTDGGFFGEQAFSLSVSPRRTASAQALKATELLEIPRRVLLTLHAQNREMTELLEQQFSRYISDKMDKLTEGRGTLRFSGVEKQVRRLAKREVLYRQGAPARDVYLLSFGSVELRKHDQQLQCIGKTDLGVGEMFGNEVLADDRRYRASAVARQESEVIVMPAQRMGDYLAGLSSVFQPQQDQDGLGSFHFSGRTLQFRGQHEGLPTVVTLFLHTDGREVSCHRAVQADLLHVNTLGVKPERTVSYRVESALRQLFLADGFVVGLHETGQWDDTAALLDVIHQKTAVPDEQLRRFEATGHLGSGAENKAASEEILCQCMRVRLDAIENLIKREICSIKQISEKTGAATVCGGCRPAILEMLGNDVWTPCKVVQTIHHNENVRSFQLRPLSGGRVAFIPGQHIILRALIGQVPVRRSYTLTGRPGEKHFEVTIKREEKGLFSNWLFGQDAQDLLLHVSGPFGDHCLTDANTPVICLGAGIGITPFLAFCRDLAQKKSPREMCLDYSARGRENFVFAEELAQIAAQTGMALTFRDTQRDRRLDEDVLQRLLDRYPDSDIYLCGPARFEAGLLEVLRKLGVPGEKIHIERFVQASQPPEQAQKEVA